MRAVRQGVVAALVRIEEREQPIAQILGSHITAPAHVTLIDLYLERGDNGGGTQNAAHMKSPITCHCVDRRVGPRPGRGDRSLTRDACQHEP